MKMNPKNRSPGPSEQEELIEQLEYEISILKDRLNDAVNVVAAQEKDLLTAKEEGARSMLEFLNDALKRDNRTPYLASMIIKLWRE